MTSAAAVLLQSSRQFQYQGVVLQGWAVAERRRDGALGADIGAQQRPCPGDGVGMVDDVGPPDGQFAQCAAHHAVRILLGQMSARVIQVAIPVQGAERLEGGRQGGRE